MESNSNLKNEAKATLWLIALILLSIGVFTAYAFGFDFLLFRSKGWIYLLLYVVVVVVSNWINSKLKYKLTSFISIVLNYPLRILATLAQYTLPIIALIIYLFYFFILSVAIPILLLKANEYFSFVEISKETNTFITFTFSAIISTTFFDKLLKLAFALEPFRVKVSEKMKTLRIDELVEYVLTKNNIRFIIYSTFFIYLCAYSFQMLEGEKLFSPELHDKAILQSFLTFLAYDRILSNSKDFKLIPSILLHPLANSINQKKSSESDNKKEE